MFTIPNGGAALFRIAGKDDTEQYRFIGGTISTDDFANSYIFKVPMNQDRFGLKSRPGSVPAGTIAPVNVTVNAVDDRGVALPPQVFNFQIQGPPLPPAATHVVMYEGPNGVDGSFSSIEPGSATIPL